jgi:hypothetical protein
VLECTPGVVEPLLEVLAAALSKAATHDCHHDGDRDHDGHHPTGDSSRRGAGAPACGCALVHWSVGRWLDVLTQVIRHQRRRRAGCVLSSCTSLRKRCRRRPVDIVHVVATRRSRRGHEAAGSALGRPSPSVLGRPPRRRTTRWRRRWREACRSVRRRRRRRHKPPGR